MEYRLKLCSLLFMVTCMCLMQTSITETTSSHMVAALQSTSLASEPEGVRHGDQVLQISGWDANLWGSQPNASNAAAVLLRQFSGGKSRLSLEQFQSLLLCLSAGTDCPASDNPAFLALSNCTSNSALPHAQCQAFNKCLSQSEVEELYGSTDNDGGLDATGLETLLPAVVTQIRQCYASSAAVRTRVHDQDLLYSNREVDELSVNETDAVTTIEPGKKKPSQGEVWGYGMLFVTLISVCSLVGVSVLPLMARAMYQQMMTGLIGLAVGSLAASAAFHLLPQAYNLAECSKLRSDGDPHGSHDYLFMSLYFLVGLWAFFMIERLIKLCIMRHSARRQKPSVVKTSPSSEGIVNSGSDELPSPCPSVTVLSVRHQVTSDSDQQPTESKVDEMNRRNSSYHNTSDYHKTAKPACGDYGSNDCPSHDAHHCCIIPRPEGHKPPANTSYEGLNNTVFCDNACCKNHAYGGKDPDDATTPSLAHPLSAAAGGALAAPSGCPLESRHLSCSSVLSRSCSNDISCAGVACKPLDKEEVDLIYASQHQAIKASFGHEQKPAAGGHSHAAVEYHPGESSVIRTVAWMIIFGDGFHNFLDGVSIGAAFSVNKMTGISVSLAVMCEELPHELGDFAVLLNAGMSMKQALMYNFLSATTCYAGLVLGILLGEFTTDNSYIFALAAGMFIYISCVDMVPELNEVMNTACEKGTGKDVAWIMLLQNLGLMLGAGLLFLLAYYQDQIALD